MPELPHEKIKKFVEKHKISEEDAKVLAAEKLLAELYEKVAEEVDPNLAARWLRRELVRVMNYNNKEFKDLLIDERHIIELLKMVEAKTITDAVGKKILEELMIKPFSPKEYVAKMGVKKIADSSEIEKIVKEAIAESPKAVEDYKKGNAKAAQFIVGAVMKKTKGQADPGVVNKIIVDLLK
jgi:aspartyl-tRNA(Asn)/glutamyl-tRNA(Gln) amidotransferase subunit B